MKKRSLSLILAVAVLCSLTVTALAAGDVVWSKDTTLTSFINRYNNATVKAGVTVTMKVFKPDPQGLEIVKSLTVEKGGTITGGGCIIFERGATCTGLDLYYKVAGVEKPLTVTLADVVASEPHDDYRPTFLFDSATGHYVLAANYDNDPFEQPPAGGGHGGQQEDYTRTAEKLRALGLFMGSDKGFELDRTPTRTEAVIMLLRLLGNRDADLRAYPAEKCPFTDADTWENEWMKGYLGFAYDHGLTQGEGDGKFGMGNASAQQFATFVLRAMGYTDDTQGGTDFTYDGAIQAGIDHHILRGEGDAIGFNRGVCVRIMEAALAQKMKSGELLWEKLVKDGVFTKAQYTELFING